MIIGIPPLQFPVLVLLMRFVESMSHANIRMSFGWLGDRLIVSPRFHRLHHGYHAAGRVSFNYGAVFTIWDVIFRTANFAAHYPATGDRNAPEAMATGGYFAQQWSGFWYFSKRLGGKARAPPGPGKGQSSFANLNLFEIRPLCDRQALQMPAQAIQRQFDRAEPDHSRPQNSAPGATPCRRHP